MGKNLIWLDSDHQPLYSFNLGFSECKAGVCLPLPPASSVSPSASAQNGYFYFHLNCHHPRQSHHPLLTRLVQKPPSWCPVTTHALSNPFSSLALELPFPNTNMIIRGRVPYKIPPWLPTVLRIKVPFLISFFYM